LQTTNTEIISGDIILEACLDLPEGPGRFPGVVLCHPHPLYGGDMYNNVISAVGRKLTERGIAALRFNFRGVGRSGGRYENGMGEQEDALAALVFFKRCANTDPDRLGIMGYSFGGMIAMAVGEEDMISKAVAGVSPVVLKGSMRNCGKPKYVICGSDDFVVPSPAIIKEVGEMSGPKKVEVIKGADHSWWGFEDEMATRVADFFKKVL